MNIINIFKRQKPVLPPPEFTDNWKQKWYDRKIEEGVSALQFGRTVCVHDTERGYELALDIKRRFIQEYANQLAEKIKVEHTTDNVIFVSIKR